MNTVVGREVNQSAASSPTPPVVTPPPPQPGAPPMSDAQAQQMTSDLLAVNDQLAPFAEVLDPGDKNHMAKSRPGVEQQIPLLVTLMQKYGVVLNDYPVDQFATDVAMAARLTEVQGPAIIVNQVLADTIYATKSRYFSALTTIYSALVTLSSRDPALALELAPLRKLFTPTAPRKTKKGGATSASASSADNGQSPAATGISASGTVASGTATAANPSPWPWLSPNVDTSNVTARTEPCVARKRSG